MQPDNPTDTETLAEVRLTDAERDALAKAVVGEFIDHAHHNPAHGLGVFDRSRCDRLVAPAVERILAARIVQARAGEGALRERVEALIARADARADVERRLVTTTALRAALTTADPT